MDERRAGLRTWSVTLKLSPPSGKQNIFPQPGAGPAGTIFPPIVYKPGAETVWKGCPFPPGTPVQLFILRVTPLVPITLGENATTNLQDNVLNAVQGTHRVGGFNRRWPAVCGCVRVGCALQLNAPLERPFVRLYQSFGFPLPQIPNDPIPLSGSDQIVYPAGDPLGRAGEDVGSFFCGWEEIDYLRLNVATQPTPLVQNQAPADMAIWVQDHAGLWSLHELVSPLPDVGPAGFAFFASSTLIPSLGTVRRVYPQLLNFPAPSANPTNLAFSLSPVTYPGSWGLALFTGAVGPILEEITVIFGALPAKN